MSENGISGPRLRRRLRLGLLAILLAALVAPPGGLRQAALAEDGVGTQTGQSPIDITPDSLVAPGAGDGLPPLRFSYRGGATLERVCLEVARGEATPGGVEAIPEVVAQVARRKGILRLGERRYRLVSFHWHSPSEHLVDGRPAAMELHLVHEELRGGRPLILAVPYIFGQTNEAIEPLFSRFADFEDAPCLEAEDLDLEALLPPRGQRTSYRYSGSLTTADANGDFAEGVRWIVLTTPVAASAMQIVDHMLLVDADLAELEFLGKDDFDLSRPNPPGNARALQSLHGRKVLTDLDGASPGEEDD